MKIKLTILLITIWLSPFGVVANSYLDSLETALQLASPQNQPETLNKLARIYIDTDVAQALIYSNRAQKLSKEHFNTEQEILALNNIGLAHTKKKQYSKANLPFDQATKLAHKNKLKELEAYSWHNLGKAYYLRGWSAEAQACFDEANKHFLSRAATDAFSFNCKGEELFLKKRYEKALDNFKEAYNLAAQHSDPEQKYIAAQNLNSVHTKLGNTADAEFFASLLSVMSSSEKLLPQEQDVAIEEPTEEKQVEKVVDYKVEQAKEKPVKQTQNTDNSFYLKIIYALAGLLVLLLYLMYLVRKKYLKILQNHSGKSDQDNQKLMDTNFLLREEIKKRLETEKTIIQEKAFLDSLVNSIPDHISYKDTKGKYIGCNNAYTTFHKRAANEIKGKTEFDINDNTKAEVISKIEREIEKTGKPWHEKTWDKRADGKKVLLDILKTPFYSPEKTLLGVITISRDMTAIQKAEEEIIKLSHAVEQSPVPIIITNPVGDVEYINPMFSEVTGYSREDAIGNNIRFLKSGKMTDKVYKELWETISSGNNWSGELLNKRKNGEHFWDNTNISPIYDKKGNISHYLATKEDITIRKQQEQEVLEAKIAAENANRTKSEFLAKMSHEIRTPMNGIIGMADILLSSEIDQEFEEQTRIIKSSANNLMSIINDIFDYTKMETEEIELEIFPFTVAETVKEVSGYLMEKLKEKNLKLFMEIDPELPKILNGDQIRLRQVLLNLANNAIKFTNTGEIRIIVNVDDMTAEKILVQFKVKDTGIGISKVGREKLFQSFSQVDDTNSRTYGGTGLGLVIAKRLVEAMGGAISVISEPGKGSEFTFTAWLEIGESNVYSESKQFSCENLRVLLAHPDKQEQERLVKLFHKMNCKPDLANNAQDAFAQLNKFVGSPRMYDVVVVNNTLPDSDGELFTNMLHADKFLKGTKVILLIDENVRIDEKEYEQIGVFGFVKKPSEFENLKKSILKASVIKQKKSPTIDKHKDNSKLTSSGAAMKILLVEDNLINQKVAGLNLKKMSYEYDVANNGKVAVDMCKKHPYPIVIMDIQMPVMDGFEATKAIRQHEKETGQKPAIIIALTANAMRGDREKYLNAGMDEYLSKPLNPSELKRVLQEFKLML